MPLQLGADEFWKILFFTTKNIGWFQKKFWKLFLKPCNIFSGEKQIFSKIFRPQLEGGMKTHIENYAIFSVVEFCWKNIQYFQWLKFWKFSWKHTIFSVVKSDFFLNHPPPNGGGAENRHSLTNRLKTHVNSLGGGGGGKKPRFLPPPPRIFERGTSRARSTLKIFFAVFVQICSSENIFGVFNICCFFLIQGQKKISSEKQVKIRGFLKIFFVGKNFFCNQNFFRKE